MLNEIKTGLGRYFGRYYDDLIPTTKAMHAFVQRGLSKSIVWGPGRKVDAADDMLADYRKNNNDLKPGLDSHLPIIVVALSRDLIPALEWGRSQGNPVDVVFPMDPKQRAFKLKQALGEIRLQFIVMAADEPTARSLALQFEIFISAFKNRKFMSPYRFAGFDYEWPAMIETPDVFVNHSPNDQTNICILSQDLTVRVAVPLPYGPPDSEASDGLGTTPRFGEDPSGYPLAREITVNPMGLPEVHFDIKAVEVPATTPATGTVVEIVTTESTEPIP